MGNCDQRCADLRRGALGRANAAALSTSRRRAVTTAGAACTTARPSHGLAATGRPTGTGGPDADTPTSRHSCGRAGSVGGHTGFPAVSRRSVPRLVRRGPRTTLLPVWRVRSLCGGGSLLPYPARRTGRRRVQGAADTCVRSRPLPRRDDGVSAWSDGEGLDMGRLAGLSESETGRSARAVSNRDHDRAASGGDCSRRALTWSRRLLRLRRGAARSCRPSPRARWDVSGSSLALHSS